jgi:hypothetical protein
VKLLVVSDLILEFPNSRYVPPRDNYYPVIYAGDIHYGPQARHPRIYRAVLVAGYF